MRPSSLATREMFQLCLARDARMSCISSSETALSSVPPSEILENGEKKPSYEAIGLTFESMSNGVSGWALRFSSGER